MSWFGELIDWLRALDRDFAFLLALPFLVALAGLARALIDRLCTPPSSSDIQDERSK